MHGHRVWGQDSGFGGDGQCRADALAYIRHQLLTSEAYCDSSSAGREDIAELEEPSLREDAARGAINSHQRSIPAYFHDRHEMQTQQDNDQQSMESQLSGVTMATANANWIMHPGLYLKEE